MFLDIDECLDVDSYCARNTKCIDLPGSYTCACLDGYAVKNDGDEYFPKPGCSACTFTNLVDNIFNVYFSPG